MQFSASFEMHGTKVVGLYGIFMAHVHSLASHQRPEGQRFRPQGFGYRRMFIPVDGLRSFDITENVKCH